MKTRWLINWLIFLNHAHWWEISTPRWRIHKKDLSDLPPIAWRDVLFIRGSAFFAMTWHVKGVKRCALSHRPYRNPNFVTMSGTHASPDEVKQPPRLNREPLGNLAKLKGFFQLFIKLLPSMYPTGSGKINKFFDKWIIHIEFTLR